MNERNAFRNEKKRYGKMINLSLVNVKKVVFAE